MERFISILGIISLLALALYLSPSPKRINKKLVLWGLGLQIALGLLIIGIPALGFEGPLRFFFDAANNFIVAVIGFTNKGSEFVFGSLMNVKSNGFIFAFQVLPTIIFFSSFMSVLYHLGVMQKVIHFMALIMSKTMGTSGAESLSMAANVFVGQTEAPLVVKPYVAKMTESELFTLMTGGMATVAGGVLAAYVGLLKDAVPGIGGHLLTASFMSAPAALIFAKILLPETKTPVTLNYLPKSSGEKPHRNVIEAAAAGASDGLKMALNVAAMLLAFIALIALLNSIFAWAGELYYSAMGTTSTTPFSFQMLLGWVFSPLAWLMGIPLKEATIAGGLLGEKVVLNEFVAYVHMGQLTDQLSERSLIILSYALCGFANFSSIAIQIGGIGEIAPGRKSDLAGFGIRAVIGGSFAAFMTACIAGILI